MWTSLFSRGALSLAVLSLLSTSASAEVFEKLSAVPKGIHRLTLFL
jgi:tripeptidyl-peptidase-1